MRGEKLRTGIKFWKRREKISLEELCAIDEKIELFFPALIAREGDKL